MTIHPISICKIEDIVKAASVLHALAQIENDNRSSTMLSQKNVDHLNKAVSTVLDAITQATTKGSTTIAEPLSGNLIADSAEGTSDKDQTLRQKCMELSVYCRSSPYGRRDHQTIMFANDIYNYISSGKLPDFIKS